MSAILPLEEDVPIVDDLPDQLAAVRRADWRFLLPDPTLGRVAYLGPHDPALSAALRAVTGAVDLLDPPAPAAGPYDVVVLTGAGASASAAARARALLRPGGWLYAEVRGRQAGRTARALRGGGFADVAAYWLWPDASACREMVPLNGPALREAIGRRDPGARLRPRVQVARTLAATPALRLAARSAAVLGSAP